MNGSATWMRCDKCNKAVSISVYDEILEDIRLAYGTWDKIGEVLPDALENCKCGGKYLATEPARCPKCRAEIKKEDFLNQTGVPAISGIFSNGMVPAKWKTLCSFCGKEDKTVQLVHNHPWVFACSGCRNGEV